MPEWFWYCARIWIYCRTYTSTSQLIVEKNDENDDDADSLALALTQHEYYLSFNTQTRCCIVSLLLSGKMKRKYARVFPTYSVQPSNGMRLVADAGKLLRCVMGLGWLEIHVQWIIFSPFVCICVFPFVNI